MQCDRSRLLSTGERDATVQPPGVRKTRVRDRFSQGVGRPAQDRRRLRQVVLKEPCFGKGGPDIQLIVATQGPAAQDALQEGWDVRPAPSLEGGADTSERGRELCDRHREQYTKYTYDG